MSDLEDARSGSIPSIFIDSNVLTSTLTPRQNDEILKMFNESENIQEQIHSTVIPERDKLNFYEEMECSKEYAEFGLYVERRCNIKQNFFVGNLNDEEQYCWTPESSADDEHSIDEETALYIFIQELPNGIIINSNVYLTNHQWNTIIIDDCIVFCVFCDYYLTRNDIFKHINSDEHKIWLEVVKPLAKYDLSIVRKIREKYHCGVCNVTFDISGATEHTDLKSHEENLLFAINKVSDVIEYCKTENDSNSSYKSCDNINNDNVINDDNDDVINNDNDIYNPVNDDDDEYINEWVLTANNNPELSYANKLKLHNSAPKDYVVELKNKNLKVSFNCWHMIAITLKNEFYCMACKVLCSVNLKFQHCESEIHLENLKKCEIDDRFADYFIRKVEHLYHCGHCNAIYPNIEDHLLLRHPRKTRKQSENLIETQVKNVQNNDTQKGHNNSLMKPKRTSENLLDANRNIAGMKNVQNNDTQKVDFNNVNINDKVNNNSVKINDKSINNNDNATASTSDNQHIVLVFFSYKVSLPVINLNAILAFKSNLYFNFGKNYFCTLCNVKWDGKSIMPHANNVYHIQLIQNTPFIEQFNCHMIRNINGLLHCALCNELLPPIFINHHIAQPGHLHNLRISVTYNNTPSLNKNNDEPNLGLNTNNDNERKENKVILNDETNEDEEINETQDEAINDTQDEAINDTQDEAINSTDNEEINVTLNDTIESDIDLDAQVFVKINSVHFKVTCISYNSLVPKGDGNRYCFVCSSHVIDDDIKHHIESRSHIENIDNSNFTDSFEGVPLRQMYLIYHCCICNVLIKRSQLKDHLDWPSHITELENARKLSKKQRKVEIKNGTPHIIVKTGKEVIYNKSKEPTTKILYNVLIVDKTDIEIKMYKMIIIESTVLKVAIDNWNGIVVSKDGIRCIICQKEIDDKNAHVKSEDHNIRVEYPFLKQHLGELIREINKNSYHCIVCNVEVSSLDDVVSKHIEGKKHKKNYETIKNFSSQTSNYDDCIGDVLQL